MIDSNSAEAELLSYLEVTQREAVDALMPFCRARAAEKVAAEEKAPFGAVIRGYLESHPDEEYVSDDERGIVARLQRRNGRDTYDIASMPDPLVLGLARAGALNVDTTVLKGLENKLRELFDARKYRIPGGQTVALVVRERER